MAHTDGDKRLEGFKEIADYVSKAIGRPFSEDAARKAARRPVCPLPVHEFNGRYTAERASVDEWILFTTNRRLRSLLANKVGLVAA